MMKLRPMRDRACHIGAYNPHVHRKQFPPIGWYVAHVLRALLEEMPKGKEVLVTELHVDVVAKPIPK